MMAMAATLKSPVRKYCRVALGAVLILASASPLHGQPAAFMKTYNNGHAGYSIREVAGPHYAVGGGTDFYYNYHWMMLSSFATTNVHLFRTDDRGDLLWETVFGNLNSRTIARWMEPVSGGGFILAGSDNRDVSWPPDSNDIVLIRTDAAGALAWSVRFDSGKDELGFCVKQTFDGGFILSGFHDNAPVSLAGNTFAVLVKTDAAGNIQWEKRYSLAVRDFVTGEAFPFYVCQAADSGFIVTGTTMGAHAADLYVFRTDPSGNLVWARSYEHDNSVLRLSLGLDIIESTGGEIVIAASLDKDRNNNQNNYPCIVRLDSAGTLLDARFYETNPLLFFQSGFSSVHETQDSGYVFTGIGGYAGFGDQMQLLKTDRQFDMEWSRVYTWDGVATMGARSGRQSSDGNYIFTGKRQFAGTVLLKTNNQGLVPCKNPDVLTEIFPNLLTVVRNPTISTALTAYPFPLGVQSPLADTNIACQAVTLPVEYLRFSARVEGSTVKLEWITASEVNNDYFIVERSDDGQRFDRVGLVDGHGTTSEKQSYVFTDHPGGPLAYYRLRQVDFDGRHHLSDIVAARPGMPGAHAWHDESAGQVIVRTNECGDKVTGSLWDMSGRLRIASQTVPTTPAGYIRFPVTDLQPGLYLLRMECGGQSLKVKIRL